MSHNNDKIIVVNKDDFRSMIRGGKYTWSQLYEPLIHKTTEDFIKGALSHGFDVIVDECHLREAHRRNLIDVAKSISPDIKVIFVHFTETSKNIEYRMSDHREISREKWIEVLDNMKKSFEPIAETEYFDELITVSIPK